MQASVHRWSLAATCWLSLQALGPRPPSRANATGVESRRGRSIFSGQLYGYGWFLAELRGHSIFYAWGYGGQFIFVVPDLQLTVVTTSEPSGPRDFEHLGAIYDVLRDEIIPAGHQVIEIA